MHYINCYDSPAGKILLAASEFKLSGLWFENQKYFAEKLGEVEEKNLQILDSAKNWLDIYFSGRQPEKNPDFHFDLYGTPFQVKVWQLLMQISYGTTATYGDVAKFLKTSPRAVANAVAHNPISIIIPCHRVIGSDGKLKGYSAGLDKKKFLLELEKKSHM